MKRIPGFDEDYKIFVLNRRQTWENLDQITKSDVREIIIELIQASLKKF